MTLPELGKLGDLDFDQNFKNWPPNDPPTPLNVNLTPLWEKMFFRAIFQNFFTLQTFIGPSYNTLWWEKSVIFIFEGPRGVKGGLGGQKYKYGSKCLKLPKTSRKAVNLLLLFQCIYLINT